MPPQLSPSWTGFQRLDAARGTYRLVQSSFQGAGVDNWTDPPWQNPDLFTQLLNIMPVSTGTISRRWGYGKIGTLGTAADHLDIFQKDNAGTLSKYILGVSTQKVTALTESGASYNSAVLTPSAGAGTVYTLNCRNYNYFTDGEQADLQKWDGSASGGVTMWGVTAPSTAITLGSPTSGNITLSIGRSYFAVFETSSGNYSDLNPVSASTGVLNSQQVGLSAIPTSADAQVTNVVILATADGNDQTTLYELGTVTNGTTTFADNVAEETLLAANVWQDTDSSGYNHGVADNQPPPTPRGIPILHRGRLFLLDGDTLYFSKSLDDTTTSTGVIAGRWEECWPGTYQLQISKGAERGTALYSDGQVLYIGTERTVYRLAGTGPSDFQEPETIFTEAGILNQFTWDPVFRGGQLLGSMWLTPDFRVIQSDFSTYLNVGLPVQTLLNSINPAQLALCNSTYVGVAPYDLWVLAIPTGSNTTCDTLLVYDLNAERWFVWQPKVPVTALLFNVTLAGTTQFLYSGTENGPTGTTPLYQFASTYTQDSTNGVLTDIPYTIQTSWFNGGDPQLRCALNDVEIVSADITPLVTVEGALNATDFDSPNTIVANMAIQRSPWGTNKLWLCGFGTHHRWYRFTFSNTKGTARDIFSYLSVEVVPFNRF